MNDYITSEERLDGLRVHAQALKKNQILHNDQSNYGREVPQLLNQKEAAAILRKPPRWLERKRWAGGGPPFRYIGRTPIYELNALLDWIEAQPVIKHTSE